MIYMKNDEKVFIEVAFQKDRFFKIYMFCRYNLYLMSIILFAKEK